MEAVSDTGPLNYLVLTKEIRWLGSIFGRVVVPKAVVDELLHPRSPEAVKSWAAALPPYVVVGAPGDGGIADLTATLGAGERDAIRLAFETGSKLLTDDRKAHLAAARLGLEPVGTLGLIIRAAELGLTDLSRAFDALEATSFHWSVGLKDDLLAKAGRPR